MPIELAWDSELDPAFDLYEFARRVLERAMEDLESDGYLDSAVFIITATNIYCYDARFQSLVEKETNYLEVVRLGRELHATAIITLNDAYTGEPGTFDPDTYKWGDLAKKHSGECIFVSVSGLGLENWSLEVQYKRENGVLIFAEPKEGHKEFLGMLHDWALKGQRLN